MYSYVVLNWVMYLGNCVFFIKYLVEEIATDHERLNGLRLILAMVIERIASRNFQTSAPYSLYMFM